MSSRQDARLGVCSLCCNCRAAFAIPRLTRSRLAPPGRSNSAEDAPTFYVLVWRFGALSPSSSRWRMASTCEPVPLRFAYRSMRSVRSAGTRSVLRVTEFAFAMIDRAYRFFARRSSIQELPADRVNAPSIGPKGPRARIPFAPGPRGIPLGGWGRNAVEATLRDSWHHQSWVTCLSTGFTRNRPRHRRVLSTCRRTN
jgi:hypothetical protein